MCMTGGMVSDTAETVLKLLQFQICEIFELLSFDGLNVSSPFIKNRISLCLSVTKKSTSEFIDLLVELGESQPRNTDQAINDD